MGGSSSKCSCFSGLAADSKKGPQPDSARSHPVKRGPGRSRVASFQEAFDKLQRPQEGNWMPSPGSNPWSSPAPKSTSLGPTSLDDEVEELRSGIAVHIDTDLPRSKLGDGMAGFKSRSKFELEQLFASPGSLPAPLPSDRREAAIRSLLPTATYEMMNQVPRELLTKQSDEAQTLRRKILRGATIVFVSAGLPSKRFTFERAAELGVKCVIIDHPDSWSTKLVDEGIVAKFLPVDMTQSSDMIFKHALAHIEKLGEDGVTGYVDGIASFVELSIPLVARLSEELGLPGHLPTAVDNARDKHATRACLKVAGLPTPKNHLIKKETDVDLAGRTVGFPAVLKPVSGAASLGVKKVTSMADLRKTYKEIVAEMSSLVIVSGALVQNDGTGKGNVAQGAIDLTLLLEQYLDGPEVDVDIVMSEGEWVYAGVSDNGPTLEPYFNETWAASPSLLPKDQQLALRDLAINATKSLGFTGGVFHVECKYTSSGPQLIECNCRMGGGQVRECNKLTWGVDLVEETLFHCLGIPARPMLPKVPLNGVAYCYVNATRSGTVKDLLPLYALRSVEGVIWAKPLTSMGAKVVGPEAGLPTWLCDLLVTRPTAKQALEFLHQLEADAPVRVG
eukprot:TRINITY_DN2493_c0_g1_i12.p1 TRINITY_DN2493_c0_g1~~TRINITY_DN2493_c0_g1_i12.p1  ORF type:complete len:619 (+),score=169.47 TRINITY_DN2493_c0_g1_i12:80-1936(+)